ncbi:MAG: competence/damage-inducible protein A, partial [Oscillospiraceae bacterium]|nr:competence/damage-inducible protein A [Oscillospiraceae bacterium]
TTGGLGPTYDDITKQTLAESFGLPLVLHQPSLDRIKAYFARSKRVMTDNNISQAMLPEGCTVLDNDWGTAPGVAFEAQGKTVIMLPGPPRECEPMLRERVVPYLAAKSDAVMVSRNIRVVGLGESAMEAMVREQIEQMTNPTVAPYAKTNECLLRVTAKAKTKEEAWDLTEPVVDDLSRQLGEFVYGVDVSSLEAAVFEHMKERGLTLSAAESCTGGMFGERFTSQPGSSAVWRGGVCTYSNDLKTSILGVDAELISTKGAVSGEVAKQMAEGVRRLCATDVGVGITGVAGPAASEQKPVGLVYVAVSDAQSTVVRELRLSRGRERIRIAAVVNALDMVRRKVLGFAIQDAMNI